MSNGTTYRRGSVFGALLLIAIGALFLYANMNPEFSPWPVLARYWPVLIIFWGLSRLVDYFALRGTEQAAAVTRISAGDIIGLLFILIFGMLFTQIVRRGMEPGHPFPIRIGDEDLGCLFGKQFEFTDEIRQQLPPGANLDLSNLRGAVNVAPIAGNEALLNVRKTVCAASEPEARQIAESTSLTWEGSGGNYHLRWSTTGATSGFTGAAVEAQVPARVNLTLATERGNASVRGIEGNVELRVERGDTTVENVGGDVRVDIRRGDVTVADILGAVRVDGRGGEVEIRNVRGGAIIQGEYGGPIRVASVQGPTRFESRRTKFSASKLDGEVTTSGGFRVRGVPGDVSLDTKDYEIELEEVTGEIRIENRNGPVRIRMPRAPRYPIHVETRSGDIELVLPTDSGFQVAAEARDGEIQSDFEGPDLKLVEEDGRDAATLKGTHGKGGVPIQLTTRHGVIYLRRR